ncbi:MAG: cytidylate kinase-like family protein [Clostridia bacterium]|nr:cytidylate kinase-like family protein [Clostridia bacterium]
MKNCVITIARQFGSGGRMIGEKLAKDLDIPSYDRELITKAVKDSGVNPNVFANVDERAVNSLLYALSMGIYNIGNTFSPINTMPDNDRLYIAQHKVINNIANEGPCVIIGRCGDYILKDRPNILKVFIYADMEYRKKRVCEMYGIEPHEAETTINKTDKTRANYYSFYTSQKWGDPKNYDLCLNSSSLGEDGCVEMIKKYLEVKRCLCE